MNEILAISSVAAGAFVATNLDNLVLLVAFLTRFPRRSFNVVAAYFSGVLFIGFVAFWIGKAADYASVEYLGLLGLVPISIGSIGIIKLFRGPANEAITAVSPTDGVKTAYVATLVTQLGNGADTIVTFGALFADSKPASDLLVSLTMAAMAVVFGLVALYAVRHPAVSRSIEQHAHRVTPFILLIVGAYIVLNTATDVLPG